MEQQIVIKPYQKDWHEEYLLEKRNLFLYLEEIVLLLNI